MHCIAKTIEISTIHFFTLTYSSPQFITSLAPHRSYGLKNRVSCLVRMLKLRCTYHTYLTSTSRHSSHTPHIPPTFTSPHMQHASHTNKTKPHHPTYSEPQPFIRTSSFTPSNHTTLSIHTNRFSPPKTPTYSQHHPVPPTPPLPLQSHASWWC